MKRSTCKVLLWIGIIWLIIISLEFAYLLGRDAGQIPFSLYYFLYFFICNIPAWILLIIAKVKWNSEKTRKR